MIFLLLSFLMYASFFPPEEIKAETEKQRFVGVFFFLSKNNL